MPNKIDSNATGLRYLEEQSPGVLPATPVWKLLEPNSYGDFGATTKTVARNPFTPSRQRFKGAVVDLDATVNFNSDLTSDNLLDFMQGFLFANWRKKVNITPTAVAAGSYTVSANGTNFVVNDIIMASGYTNAVNNGMKVVTASTATSITAGAPVVEATATGLVKKVGFQFASGDATITVTSGVAALVTTAKDLTTLGLIPGEWVFLGGDSAATQFANATNNVFARVATISTNKITFDKTNQVMVADTGAAKTIQMFFGDVLKNESDPNVQAVHSYQFERSLGSAGYEYPSGQFPNQLTIKLTQGDKINCDLAFVGMDSQPQLARKSGTFNTAVTTSTAAFNTASDFSRLRLEKLDATGLTSYVTDATITINNNITPVKALGKLGTVDTSAGEFAVSGSLTALFTDVNTVLAVRNYTDVTMDFTIVARNTGVTFDMPLMGLGDGKLKVEQDKPITLPLNADAAAHPVYNHTLLVVSYAYLPNLADSP